MAYNDEPTREDAESLLREAVEKGLDAVEVVRRLLLEMHLGRWFHQRLASDGGGRIKDIRIRQFTYEFTTWDDDQFEFRHGSSSGSRWLHNGSLISRTAVERFLGVWPGYIDAVEDLTHKVAELLEEVEREKNEYAGRLEAEYKAQHQRLVDWSIKSGKEAAQRAANERHPQLRAWREKQAVPIDSRPAALRQVRHVKRLEVSEPCFVYFLLLKGSVVYVGQTTAPWPTRILTHLKDGTKEFDDVWFLEVDRPSLYQVERQFIEAFNPPYNRVHTSRVVQKASEMPALAAALEGSESE